MKPLIVYFSWSNNTKKLVKEVNASLGYTTLRIERKVPYSNDYTQCAYVEAKEEWEKRTLPEIKDIALDLHSYDSILLFFPIWWYTIPMGVGTFLKNSLNGYKGKVILFANSYTDDPQYIDNSYADLKKLNPDLNLVKGLQNKSVAEHISFIGKELGK